MSEYLNPNVSSWIADLSSEDARALAEKLMKTRGPQVSELPVKDLQAQLELSWAPDAAFLEPGSIDPLVAAYLATRYKWIGDTYGEQFTPNDHSLIGMKVAGGATAAIDIIAGAGAETWWAQAHILTRSDSANDTGHRSQIRETTQGAEVGVAWSQREYWGTGKLASYTTNFMQGPVIVPAGAKRTLAVYTQIHGNSDIGGYAYAGGATHNYLFAQRVA